MENTSLQDLLDLAESATQIGIPIDSIRVCSGGFNYPDSALILDTLPIPLDAAVWTSLHEHAESLFHIKYERINFQDTFGPSKCNDSSLETNDINYSTADIQCSPAIREFELENVATENHDSPAKAFSPKNLFHEDWDAREGVSTNTNQAADSIQNIFASDNINASTITNSFLAKLKHRTTIYTKNNEKNTLNNFHFHGEAVYYWITQTHRVKDNLALYAAVQLSIELDVPIIALATIAREELDDLTQQEEENSCIGQKRKNLDTRVSLEDSESSFQPVPSYSQHQLDILNSLRRKSAIRLAVLLNLKKELAELNVPLLVISYGARAIDISSAQSRNAAQRCPLVELWRCIGAHSQDLYTNTTTATAASSIAAIEESNHSNSNGISSSNTNNRSRIAAVFTDSSDSSLLYSHHYRHIAHRSFLNCPIIAINSNLYEKKYDETDTIHATEDDDGCWKIVSRIQESVRLCTEASMNRCHVETALVAEHIYLHTNNNHRQHSSSSDKDNNEENKKECYIELSLLHIEQMQLQIDTILLSHQYASDALFNTEKTTIPYPPPRGIQLYSYATVQMYMQSVYTFEHIQHNQGLYAEVMNQLLEYYQLGLVSPLSLTASCKHSSSSSSSNMNTGSASSSYSASVLEDLKVFIGRMNKDKLAYMEGFRTHSHSNTSSDCNSGSSSSSRGSSNNSSKNGSSSYDNKSIIEYASYSSHNHSKLYYQYSVQWFRLLPKLCVQNIHHIDYILGMQKRDCNISIGDIRKNMIYLQKNQTSSSVLNGLQDACIRYGSVPLDDQMKLWLVYYIKHVYSIEDSIKIIYRSISAHYTININYTLYPMVRYIKLIETLVYEVYHSILYSNDNIMLILEQYIQKITNAI